MMTGKGNQVMETQTQIMATENAKHVTWKNVVWKQKQEKRRSHTKLMGMTSARNGTMELHIS